MYEIVFHQKDIHFEVIVSRQINYLDLLNLGSSKKELEKAAIQHLISLIDGVGELDYLPSGKPILSSEFAISISHRKDYFAIAISSNPIGVDVECISENLEKGKAYYLNEEEMKVNWSTIELLHIWTFKEALYKKMGGEMEPQSAIICRKIEGQIHVFYQGTEQQIYTQSLPNDWLICWT